VHVNLDGIDKTNDISYYTNIIITNKGRGYMLSGHSGVADAAKFVILSVRFALELCALAALGYWGFQTGHNGFFRIVLGIGAPLLTAVIWGTFVSPKASVPVPEAARFMIELILFSLSAAALYAAGHPALGMLLIIIASVNRLLMYISFK